MKLGKLDSIYRNHLKNNQSELLTQHLMLNTSFKTNYIDFDTRVTLFQSVLSSPLFSGSNVKSEDLLFWFPECVNESDSNEHFQINAEHCSTSLECILAEFMEGHFFNI